jgi:LCP family protein required for cell wall assembly
MSAMYALAEEPGYLSILLIGQDDAAETMVGVGEHPYGRADAIIVVTLNLSTGSVRMLSVDRDYMISLPDQGGTKLCLAHYLGGPQLLLEQVNELLGLQVDRYALIDKPSMGKVVTKLGGVTIDVRQEDLKETGLRKVGRQKLNGRQVIQYMGRRQVVNGGVTDVDRNERQRIALSAIMDEAYGRGLEGMVSFAEAVLPLMESNITPDDILGAAAVALRGGLSEPQEDRTPTAEARQPRFIPGHSVVYLDDMEAERERVQRFLYQE